MVVKEILELQRERPFHPLRIYLSDGHTYDVLHPEMMLVTKTKVVIALPAKPDDVPDSTVYCDPVHITQIQPLNGERQQL